MIANESFLKNYFNFDHLKYITIIRHPIDIILSNYFHITEIEKSKLTFDDYLKIDSMYIKCPLSYYFTGTDNYDLAYERATNFDAIIRLDKFSDDIKVMREFGWDELDVDKNRKGTKRNSNRNKDISEKMYNYLKIKMKMDIELYDSIHSKIENGKII
jgi:hypothetical protein